MYKAITPTSNSSGSPMLLRPQSEHPILDIRMTENPNGMLMDDDIMASRSRYFFCGYCGQHCRSQAGKSVHERSHARLLRKQKRNGTIKKSKRVRKYTCKTCFEEFRLRRDLNAHTKIHVEIIKCNFCNECFKDRMEFDIHDAIYDGLNYDVLNMPKYRTRSRSRLSCHRYVDIRCDVKIFTNDGVSAATTTAAGGATTLASTPDTLKSVEVKRTRVRKLSMSSTVYNHDPRQSITIENWIDDGQRYEEFSGANSVETLRSASVQRSDSRSSSVWSDLVAVNHYICEEDNCRMVFPSLNMLTTHEMTEHDKLALFRCCECRKRFTTKESLQRHINDFHRNYSICVLCDNPLRSVPDINEHFLLHQKYSYTCEVCGKIFLSTFFLAEHMKQNPHYHEFCKIPKGQILIRVDRRVTKECFDLDQLIRTDAYPNRDISPLSSSLKFKFNDLYHKETENHCKNVGYRKFIIGRPWRS